MDLSQNHRRSIILDCPMPKLDFDVITLGHGSGGLLTHRLLDMGVFSLLQNEWLDQQHDGALFTINGQAAMTTDSFVVSPIFFPGGSIGELAINGTVNDLAMCGAKPRYLSLAFILEEGLRVDEFWEVLVSIKEACAEAGVAVVTGDTKVVEKGKGDKIFINTTGIGEVHPRAAIHIQNVRPGDKVIVSGPIAAHGMAIMSVREGLEFETSIESDTAALHKPILHLLDSFGPDVHFLRDPTRGGVATVLTEIAKQAGTGIQLQQTAIPLDEQVEGACEMLGLDPLYVANEGIFIAIVDASIAEQALEVLHQYPVSRHAAIIGAVVEEHASQVVLQSRIGGRRVVNMLPGEQLPRIC